MWKETELKENRAAREKYVKKLQAGDYIEVESEIYKIYEDAATEYLKDVLTEVVNSKRGAEIKKLLGKKYGYPLTRKVEVTVTLGKGALIKIPSWYGQKGLKRRGRPRKGPNGNGAHLLLKYWGFEGKYSPTYVEHVAREGTSAQSYELATETLKSQGYGIYSKTVDLITHKIGNRSVENRSRVGLEEGESMVGKRVLLAMDGGRVRTRQTKKGRYKKGQKRASYQTDWRETKLFVMCELDEKGKKKKGSKPLYDATMGNADDVFHLFLNQAKASQLSDAKEIIMIGDGALWIWDRYQKMAKFLNITKKVTEVLDWYHACEHLNVIAHSLKQSDSDQKSYYNDLKSILYQGDFKLFKQAVQGYLKAKKRVSKAAREIIKKELAYFESNKNRIQYQAYEKSNKPRGSGVVESAIRRVVNQKIKSPGIFWKIQNVEKMLHLRCLLLSGRWKTMIKNVVRYSQFTLSPRLICD